MTGGSSELACSSCFEHLHAYLDGELGEAEAAAVQRHLEGCAGCFERSQLEEAFRRSIRSVAAPAAAAAPALQRRVREALDREDARREALGSRTRRRAGRDRRSRDGGRPRAARLLLLAAALLAAAATWSALVVPRVAEESESGARHPVFLRGELTCLECLMAKAGRPQSGLDPQLAEEPLPAADLIAHRRLHLRDDEGRIWELFADPDTEAELERHANVGRRALVVGTAWPELGVVSVGRLDLE